MIAEMSSIQETTLDINVLSYYGDITGSTV